MSRRARLALVAAAALAVGLGSRRWPLGEVVWDKYAGDAAYAAMVFVVVAALRPRGPRWTTAALAAVLCAAVEGLQATGWPQQWARVCPPLQYVLGTTFGGHDLLAYAVGVAMAALGAGGGDPPVGGAAIDQDAGG